MNKIRTIIKKILVLLTPSFVSKILIENFLIHKGIYYSQEGEDVILARYYSAVPKGFFVDIGAHHPIRFSNTYKLYELGWTGINVDATPGSMTPFRDIRPNDVNLELGISDSIGNMNYYLFDEPALNTFSKERAKELQATTPYKLVSTKTVPVRTLSNVLDEHLPREKTIDLLSIDVEGLDLNVLKSNDWGRYRPKMIVIEDLQKNLDGIDQSESYQYLKNLGYRLVAKTFNTLFYQDSKLAK